MNLSTGLTGWSSEGSDQFEHRRFRRFDEITHSHTIPQNTIGSEKYKMILEFLLNVLFTFFR